MNNTSTTICTYHRTFMGPHNDNILKFGEQNLENFSLLVDKDPWNSDVGNGLFENFNAGQVPEELTEEWVSALYNGARIQLYGSADFREHGFDKPISRHHFWGSHQEPKYFYAHFRMLAFYLKNPGFDFYWFFDDDVKFEGDLKGLLDSHERTGNDFIAIQAFKLEDYAEFHTKFPSVPLQNTEMGGSKGGWLGMCPGPGDNFKNTSVHMGSFFPIVGFSNNALAHLMQMHKEGWFGYSEGFVPTSLASDGYKVASMMDEFDNFYLQEDISLFSAMPCPMCGKMDEPKEQTCSLYHKGTPFSWQWI